VCLWIQHTLIRVSRDQHAFDHSPGLIAVFHALHRLLAPRHPPHALSSLAALIPSSVCRPPLACASGWYGTQRIEIASSYMPNFRDWQIGRVTIHFLLRALAETQRNLNANGLRRPRRVPVIATLAAAELSKNQSAPERPVFPDWNISWPGAGARVCECSGFRPGLNFTLSNP
jgi:hypothetical protein